MKINAYRRLQASSKFFDADWLTKQALEEDWEEGGAEENTADILNAYKDLVNSGLLNAYEDVATICDGLSYFDIMTVNGFNHTIDLINEVCPILELISNRFNRLPYLHNYLEILLKALKDILVEMAKSIEDDIKSRGYDVNGELIKACKSVKIAI